MVLFEGLPKCIDHDVVNGITMGPLIECGEALGPPRVNHNGELYNEILKIEFAIAQLHTEVAVELPKNLGVCCDQFVRLKHRLEAAFEDLALLASLVQGESASNESTLILPTDHVEHVQRWPVSELLEFGCE